MMADTTEYTSGAQTDSRLLKLPAEIRNRIYEYALGGQAIHFDTWSRKPTICISRSQDEVVDSEDARNSDCHFDQTVSGYHYQCVARFKSISIRTHLCFDLLRVCRQIYHEAALIPYTSNRFIANGMSEYVEELATHFTPKQLASMTSLQLFIGVWPVSRPLLHPRPFRPFSGLRNISFSFVTGSQAWLTGLHPTCEYLCKPAESLPQLSCVSVSILLGRDPIQDESIKNMIRQEVIGLRKGMLEIAAAHKEGGQSEEHKK